MINTFMSWFIQMKYKKQEPQTDLSSVILKLLSQVPQATMYKICSNIYEELITFKFLRISR